MSWITIGKEIPWLGRDIVYLVSESAEQTLISDLTKLGFKIVLLDGERITDDEEFFSEIAPALSFPDYFGRNWNAFNDSFSDIAYGQDKRIAIIWRRVSLCLRANLQDFLGIVHRLLRAATDVGYFDPKRESVQVEVFLLGEPPDFPKQP